MRFDASRRPETATRICHQQPVLLPRFAARTDVIAAVALRTSSSVVRQFTTLMRITRCPFQVLPLKNASPEAFTAAITDSVHAS